MNKICEHCNNIITDKDIYYVTSHRKYYCSDWMCLGNEMFITLCHTCEIDDAKGIDKKYSDYIKGTE